jgi:hypothetical protein
MKLASSPRSDRVEEDDVLGSVRPTLEVVPL